LNRCTNGAKNMCWQKVNFLENFWGRTFLDIYLDIFALCQNGVFFDGFWTQFSTHKCRDALLKNDFDTARWGVSKIFRGFSFLQSCREKTLWKSAEKTRFWHSAQKCVLSLHRSRKTIWTYQS
jgi:hypothetical protein